MPALRDEIIEAEKARSDLLKWKLIIVSGLGGAGLGFTGKNSVPGVLYVLLLIPAVCLYVDLMCRHLTLRMMVVGTFLRLKGRDEEGEYERFVAETRGKKRKRLNVFALEDWALEWSTIVLSLLVMGTVLVVPEIGRTGGGAPFADWIRHYSFVLSGGAGIVFSFLIRLRYFRRWENIEKHGR